MTRRPLAGLDSQVELHARGGRGMPSRSVGAVVGSRRRQRMRRRVPLSKIDHAAVARIRVRRRIGCVPALIRRMRLVIRLIVVALAMTLCFHGFLPLLFLSPFLRASFHRSPLLALALPPLLDPPRLLDPPQLLLPLPPLLPDFFLSSFLLFPSPFLFPFLLLLSPFLHHQSRCRVILDTQKLRRITSCR